jgi:hypothetical protein
MDNIKQEIKKIRESTLLFSYELDKRIDFLINTIFNTIKGIQTITFSSNHLQEDMDVKINMFEGEICPAGLTATLESLYLEFFITKGKSYKVVFYSDRIRTCLKSKNFII